MKKPQITLGSDPELMLCDLATGNIVSAVPVLKNSKHNPINLDQGVRLYADNTLMEFSVAPSETPGSAVMRMRDALRRIQRHLGKSFSFKAIASHNFDELPPKPDDELVIKWLSDLVPPDAVAQEWQVGCKPNYCVYSPDTPRPQKPFTNNMRTGSFHIHIGNKNYRNPEENFLMTRESKIIAVKLMDIFVGCASIIFDKDETAPARKELYGKAGEYRETKYGIEYRVLSNFALRSPSTTALVFQLTKFAMDVASFAPLYEAVFSSIDESDVVCAINENDKKLASQILNDVELPWKFRSEIEKDRLTSPLLAHSWSLQS